MEWNPRTIRDEELRSLRSFVQKHSVYLQGRVLDFGAGVPGSCREPQPYRNLVMGEYIPVDIADGSASLIAPGPYDAILCTQVIQYVRDPGALLEFFYRTLLPASGVLVMTYPTNWDEVEPNDYWRFTRAAMERMLHETGFKVMYHERRASVNLDGFNFALGYGVVARA